MLQTYRAINPHFAEKRQKHCLINFSRQWQWLTFINHQLGKLKKLFRILFKLHTSTNGAKAKLQFQIGSYLELKYLCVNCKKRTLVLYKVVFHLLPLRFFLYISHFCEISWIKENYKNLKKYKKIQLRLSPHCETKHLPRGFFLWHESAILLLLT